MKICRFDQNRVGVVRDGQVFDATDIANDVALDQVWSSQGDPLIGALPAFLARASASMHEMRALPLEHIALLSPVASPSKIVAAPVNYRAHITEMIDNPVAATHALRDIGKAGLFLKANSSLAGPSEGIAIRFPERRTDHEVELVVVIGKKGSDIRLGDAREHIAGYCLGLDISLRGPEDRSFRKSMDGYSIVGPWMVTPDEVADHSDLEISLSINGEVRQKANTKDLVYGVERLIEFASSFYTLYPGDLLFTGTPDGVGPIRPGDVIHAQGQGLGAMTVTVRRHQPQVLP